MFRKTKRIKELEAEVEKLKFWEEQGQMLARKNCDLDDELDHKDLKIDELRGLLLEVYTTPNFKKSREFCNKVEKALNLNPAEG